MKNIFMILTSLMVLISCSKKFTFIVPQKPGGGTSIWATIVAEELEKKLGEKIIIRHIPGARDQIGFEKFHKTLRFDDSMIMVSHGGNAVSFLQENVIYDYADYDVIAIMHNNIIVSRDKNLNWQSNVLIYSLHSGTVPESLALALLIDGHNAPKNWKKRTILIKGMSQSENRLAFRRREVNITRENPAAHLKHVQGVEHAEIFFNHGLYNPLTGKFDKDPNFPDSFTMEELYKQKWGESSSGSLYNAYKMVKAWRDGIQKALWVNKGNPNRDRLRKAVTDMLNDPEARIRLQKKLGKYPWDIGENAVYYVEALYRLLNRDAMQALVKFNREQLGLDSYYNEKRVQKKN